MTTTRTLSFPTAIVVLYPATMTDSTAYTRTAISLHWLIALLVFAGWGLGVYMHDLPASPDKARYYGWHKSIGVTVFLLALLRVAWRATHAPPPLPASVPAWQASASRVSHALLYLLILVIPLTGWLMSSAKGFQTLYFGVLPIPDLLGKDEPLGKLLERVHILLAFTLAGLVGLHLAAALKHHFVDRDAVLRRMLPVLLAALLLGALPASSVDLARSEVTATFRQLNVPVSGRFDSFRGSVRFDPRRTEATSARIEVDTASFDLGDADYNQEVRGTAWFDSARHPRASFVSSRVTPAGPGRFSAAGTLTFKGRAQPLEVPFTVRAGDGRRVFEGQFTLSRKAYGVGDPQWDDVLEDPVVVRFRIVAPVA
jgi:cytochrome b561/polyisoprenoid-binding protein YceI